MGEGWERVGVVAPGGTVLAMAEAAEGQLWLATGAGLLKRSAVGWQAPAQSQPPAQPSALAFAGDTLFVGHGSGQITYSRDGGESWYSGHLRQPADGVTCLVASPSFERDGVVLAGTHGSGILRSTDGGRNWEMSSFGLHDFTILALAVGREWGRRELAFAGTENGLYRSPNGGRAWKNVGLGDWVFQAIAAGGGVILAGTEAHGLFRSTDGGQHWQNLDLAGEKPAINALWIPPESGARPTCLAGSSDGRLFRSEDSGEHWTCVADAQAPILCLAQSGARLYAGLLDRGLLVSDDGGRSWAAGRDLAARALQRLEAGGGVELLAWGPMEGVWCSTGGGSRWTPLTLPGEVQIIHAVALSPEPERPCLLVSTPENLLHSEDGGQSWRAIPLPGLFATAFSPAFADDGQVWAATVSGELLASSSGGLAWTALPRPAPGGRLVGVGAGAGTLAVTISDTSAEQVTVWRSGDGGQTWRAWLQQPLREPTALLCLAGGVGQDLAVLGDTCWRATADGWQPVLRTEDLVLRVRQRTDRPGIMLVTPSAVRHSAEGQEWTAYDEGLAGRTLTDLALATVGGEPWAYLLATGGELWRRRLPRAIPAPRPGR